MTPEELKTLFLFEALTDEQLAWLAGRGLVEEYPASERVAVRVETRAFETQQHVARSRCAPVDDSIERDCPDGCADQIDGTPGPRTPKHLPHLCQLTTRTRYPGELAAPREALTEGVEPIGRCVLEGDVVHEGDRARADAEDVVHVHGNAIDTDRLQATHGLRDQELSPDPVGRDGDPGVRSNGNDVGEVADVERRPVRSGELEGRTDPA